MQCKTCHYELGWKRKLEAYEICPCCGFENEVDEDRDNYYREWVEKGCRWFSRATSAPDGWNPVRQAIEKCRDYATSFNGHERHTKYVLIESNISAERTAAGDDCGACFVMEQVDEKLTAWIEEEKD